MLKETGALISLQPNASKIVSSWNIDSFLKPFGPMADKAFRMFDQTGHLVREIQLDMSQFGAERMLYHRQDLHTALKNAATSPNISGKPAEICSACTVISCDPEMGTVTLADGDTLSADIIVGADGIHSATRASIVGKVHEAQPTGVSAYRMLIPIESLGGIDIPKDVLDLSNPVTTMVVGHDRRAIMGPGRNGSVFGIVALVPDAHMHETSDVGSWVTPGSLDALLKAYEGFPVWLLEIFRRAPDHALWQLRDIDPLPTWVQGRAILIGDAAHAMLPTQGQGASQSFEDAEALKAFLDDLEGKPSKERINEALTKAFEARYERASLIQKYSRDQAKPGTTQGSNEVKLDPAEFMKYNCDYNGARDWVGRTTGETK